MSSRSGIPFSAEHRAKISLALRGRKCPEISARMMGHTVSEETRRRISLAAVGRVPSIEARERMRLAQLGRVLPPEVRQKVADSKRGKQRPPFSQEWRRKLGEASRRVWSNPEFKTRTVRAQTMGNRNVPTYPEQVGFSFLLEMDPRWEYNGDGGSDGVVIEGFVPDYVLVVGRLVANLDGVRWHSALRMSVRDARRESAYARNGWQSFSFTDLEVLSDSVAELVERYRANFLDAADEMFQPKHAISEMEGDGW